MRTKSCPSCGLEVPAVASRCKSCFHDFDAAPPRTSGGPIFLVAAVALIAVLSAGAVWYRTQQHTDERILVDAPTRTVQWVRQYQDGRLETDRLSFDEIAKLRHEITGFGEHRILAVTTTGEEKLVDFNPDRSLQLQAQKYAQLVGKPLETVDHTTMGLLQARPSSSR